MGGASAHNAIMHSTSTKHGPAHPRDVDDVDGRWPHDVDERYTGAPHTQHEGAQPEHAQHGHAQQAGPQGPEHAHADDNRTSTLRSQHGHTGVRSIKRTAAGSAVPRPCLRSLAAVGRRHTGPGYNLCLPGTGPMSESDGRDHFSDRYFFDFMPTSTRFIGILIF